MDPPEGVGKKRLNHKQVMENPLFEKVDMKKIPLRVVSGPNSKPRP